MNHYLRYDSKTRIIKLYLEKKVKAIGNNPYLLKIDFPYNLDIDIEQNWSIINYISKLEKEELQYNES